jgi:small subunit ribosomal protein S6e
MAKFKIIVSDPQTGKSQVVELEGSRAVPLISRRLGETIDGSVIGQGGHKLRITGGCDKDGFPMRPDIHGGVRTNTILSGGVGFHPKREGERRRKTIRGNVITEEIAQINMTIMEKPQKKTEKAEKTETAKEAPKQEKPAEESELKPSQ